MTPKHDPDWLKKARSKGGHARAKAMTKKQRSASARKAAKARWSLYRLSDKMRPAVENAADFILKEPRVAP